MIVLLRQAADTLEAMRRDGVELEDGGITDDYAHLVTTDPEVAKKYDMIEESEYWGSDEVASREAEDVEESTQDKDGESR